MHITSAFKTNIIQIYGIKKSQSKSKHTYEVWELIKISKMLPTLDWADVGPLFSKQVSSSMSTAGALYYKQYCLGSVMFVLLTKGWQFTKVKNASL